MPDAKPLVFSTVTPNDQGGIIPNDVIDFSRFQANPVLLKQHNWEGEPLGLCSEWKLEGGKWTMIPVFHAITEDSKLYKELYDGNWLRACSIGGEAIWEEDAQGRYKMDADGNRICKKFILYEISMVTLPSNKDAVKQLAAENKLETAEKLATHLYWKTDAENVVKTITRLNAKFNLTSLNTHKNSIMENEILTPEEEAQAKTEALAAKKEKKRLAAEQAEKTRLAAKKEGEDLPPVIENIISKQGFWSGIASIFKAGQDSQQPPVKVVNSAPAPQNEPVTKPGTEATTVAQPTPTGLAAKREAAKKALDKAKEKAEKAHEAAKKAKEKGDDSEEFKSAMSHAEECMKACEAAEKTYNDAMDESDDGDENAAKAGGNKTVLAATKPENNKPQLKTMAELKAEHHILAPKPTQTKVIGLNSNIPQFSKLFATRFDGKLERDTNDSVKPLWNILESGEYRGAVTPENVEMHRIVLASIMKDKKFAAVVDKARFNFNEAPRLVDPIGNRPGFDCKTLMSRLESGEYAVRGRHGMSTGREMTTLTATDNFLASPDLFAIEFLPLVIFQLFASSAWKADIPMFSAQMTSENTGFVFANILANPSVTIGTQPVSPSDYTYTDGAVALNLTPFFLQPMLWYPWLMHQLRYDQMDTGWAQAFAILAQTIDDTLIYKLATSVPAGSIVSTSGISGYQTNPRTFSPGVGQNKFVWNPTFTNGGTPLNSPVLNDITGLEQLYSTQNFVLSQADMAPTVVLDPIAYSQISQDPQFQSLLTRWIDGAGNEFLKYTHTKITSRSRVVAWDTATNQVKDPYGVLPSTTDGANLSFISSQVGIGIGSLDVFFLQSPKNYGYEMSANLRAGIVSLRAALGFGGIGLYTYGYPGSGPV